MRKKCVIFDIDWVIAILKMDWKYTHDGTEEINTTINMLIWIINLHKKETMWETIILTWRNENERELTESWLAKYWVEYDWIRMRETSDRSPNATYKENELKELRYSYDIQFLVDDNWNMGEVCKWLHIPFFHYSINN